MRREIPNQDGFTLIEVLVALLVLSVGLIGIAGLQLTGVKNTRDAYYRSQAVMLAYDITDRMRANITGVTSGAYDGITGTLTGDCMSTTSCTAAELAADDVARWRADVAARLPDGDALVCVDSTPDDGTDSGSPACDATGGVYVAKVWWNDDQDTTTDNKVLSVPFIP